MSSDEQIKEEPKTIKLADGSVADRSDVPDSMLDELYKQKLMEASERMSKMTRRGLRSMKNKKFKKSNQLKRFFSVKEAKEKYPEKFSHYRIGSKVLGRKADSIEKASVSQGVTEVKQSTKGTHVPQ